MGRLPDEPAKASSFGLARLFELLRTPVFSRGIERHHIGIFADKVLARLREEATFGAGTSPVHLSIEGIELGDNPFQEELSVRFRLLANPEEGCRLPRIEELAPSQRISGPVTPGVPVVHPGMFDYTFSSGLSVEENLADFRSYVAKLAKGTIVEASARSAGSNDDAFATPSPYLRQLTWHLICKSGELRERVLSWVEQPTVDPLPAVAARSEASVERGIPIPASLIMASDVPVSIPVWFDARTARVLCPSDPTLEGSRAVQIREGKIEVVGFALPSRWQFFTVESDSGSAGEVEVFALRRVETNELAPPVATAGILDLIMQGRLYEAWQAAVSAFEIDGNADKREAIAYMIWTQCGPLAIEAQKDLEQRFPNDDQLAALRQFRRVPGYLASLRQSLLEAWGSAGDDFTTGSGEPA
jgi:hypothetical protein